MINEQNRMDIMTNNLANASTVGYKKEGSTSQSFDDVLTVKIKDQSVGMRNVQRLGVKNPGVKIGENYTDYSQGSFRITGNTYDLALSGDGFLPSNLRTRPGDRYQIYPCRSIHTEQGRLSGDRRGVTMSWIPRTDGSG